MPINMGYVMCENTYRALQETCDALAHKEISELSESEQRYAEKLFRLCREVADNYLWDGE
jgi:hypothetical protein